MANYLKVVENVTVSTGNYTESFVTDQLVSPYSMWASPLANAGAVTDSGQAAPFEDLNPAYPSYFTSSTKYTNIFKIANANVGLNIDFIASEVHAISSSPQVFTIPNDQNSRMNTGAWMYVRRMGLGSITVNAQSGVTIRAPFGTTAVRYNALFLLKINANEWVVIPQGVEAGEFTVPDVDASGVTFTPVGNITATDVQNALAEIDAEKQSLSAKNQANGYAGLDAQGKLPTSVIPSLAISNVFVTATLTTRNALTVQTGDVAVVQDVGDGTASTFIYDGATWHEITSTTVTSGGSNIASDITVTPTGTIVSTNVQSALAELDSKKIPNTQKGAPSGVATLDATGRIPAGQMYLYGGTP